MFVRRICLKKHTARGSTSPTSPASMPVLANVPSRTTLSPLDSSKIHQRRFFNSERKSRVALSVKHPEKTALCITNPLVESLPTIFDPLTCRKRDFCPIPDEPGQQVYYELHGSTSPDATKLVFVTGLNASSFAWLQQVEYFTKSLNYSILVFDNRGSGHSTSPKGLYTTTRMAKDAVVLLDHLGWTDDRSLIVVGASMGGMISMDLGLLIPNRITALVLASTKSGYRFNYPTMRTMAILARYFLGTIWTAKQSLRVSMNHMFPKEFLTRPDEKNPEARRRDTLEKEIAHRMGLTKKAPFSGQLGQMAAVIRHRMTKEGFAELAAKIPKIAIITGDKDEIVRVKDCNLLHQMLPGSQYTVLNGVGHSVMLQMPAEFNAWLAQVIKTSRVMNNRLRL